MIKFLKTIRSIYLFNRVVAFLIMKLKLKSLYPKWPLMGMVKVKFLDVEVDFYSNCDDYLVSSYYYSGFDEEVEEIKELSKLMDPSGVFLDIGAFNGLFSIILGKVYPKATFYAFEPSVANFARLKHNITTNRMANVLPINLGLGEKTGLQDFYVPSDNSITTVSSVSSAFFQNHSNSKPSKSEMKTVSIDDWCLETKVRPDIIKIDVEGYELEVLSGAQQILAKYKPVVLCEIFTKKCTEETFKSSLPNVYSIEDMMNKLGYSIFMNKEKVFVQVDTLNLDSEERNFLFIP